MLTKPRVFEVLKRSKSTGVSLSRYFPKGTHYFYAYPSGEDSGFLNLVPPSVEELVSARPLACAGGDITVITFAETMNPGAVDIIHKNLGTSQRDKKRARSLPDHIDVDVVGKDRNYQVKKSLVELVQPGSLVMAQPFMDDELDHLYQISPKLTNWLNDKQHMASYVPEDLLAKRYGSYKNGKAFASSKTKMPVPCVVKVSSSSAGDGVYICKDNRTLRAVQGILKNTVGTIIAERYIEATANYGIQFGIPEEASLPIDIIGINQQLTTSEGEFVGGIINPKHSYPELDGVKQALLTEILPHVREMGWYGVGCFDVLTDEAGRCYIIDCNFRMTGMTAYLMLVANGHIKSSLVSFGGEFHGNLAQFQEVMSTAISAHDVAQPVRVISLTERDNVCRFNAALLFDNKLRMPAMARQLLEAGVISKALDQLSKTA